MIMKNIINKEFYSCLTIDVEDWFHILDSPAVPHIEYWSVLESRIDRNLNKLLQLLDTYSVKATFFWLGWIAERHKKLVLKCSDAGHEIASHGYAHVLAYEVGPDKFKDDIYRAKDILENITGEAVRGFRAPGFGITAKAPWAFDIISEIGYQYDSSVFPAARAHGGIKDSPLGLYFIKTSNGHLLEIPMSVVNIFTRRTSLFGGGYLRLANKSLIQWGINKLRSEGQPLILYVHPREIDPQHPRLSLSPIRQFKSYINLKTTMPKLKWLCDEYSFYTLLEMVENYIRSFYLESKVIPVVKAGNDYKSELVLNNLENQINPNNKYLFRKQLLLLEEAMACFLDTGVFHKQTIVNK